MRENRETARNQHGARPAGLHGLNQRARAEIERDPLMQHMLHIRRPHALEQADALPQRRLELDLAAHRALRDRRNLRPDAAQLRHLVEAFLADDGGIHAGDEHALLAAGRRLHAPVQGAAGDCRCHNFLEAGKCPLTLSLSPLGRGNARNTVSARRQGRSRLPLPLGRGLG